MGGQDAKIVKEAEQLNKSHVGDIVCSVISLLLCALIVAVAVVSIYLNFQEESTSDTVPTIRVVKSDSMSGKRESNTYLYENDLNDQFQMFDLILTYKMPEESELQLYDIVVYKYDEDTMIIHRIIAIDPPNESHDCYYYTLRGDNNSLSDSTKVTYDQMLGIYRGERVPYAGSFVMFLQSPAGWLCVILLTATVLLTPALENIIVKRKLERWNKIKGKVTAASFSVDGFDDYDGFYDAYAPPAKALPKQVSAVSDGEDDDEFERSLNEPVNPPHNKRKKK